MRSLLARELLVADGKNGGNFALYSDRQVQKLVDLQAEGRLLDDATERAEALVPNVYDAKDGVRVFQLLDSGLGLEQIVVATGIHSHVVREIQRDYDDLAGSITIPNLIVGQMEEVRRRVARHLPELRSATDVLELLTELLRPIGCADCGASLDRPLCAHCIRRRMIEASDRPRPSATQPGTSGSPPHDGRR